MQIVLFRRIWELHETETDSFGRNAFLYVFFYNCNVYIAIVTLFSDRIKMIVQFIHCKNYYSQSHTKNASEGKDGTEIKAGYPDRQQNP